MTDIVSSPSPPLLSLFLLLLFCFSPSYRCILSSWSSPGFPWFCWHLPSWLHGNWRKTVTRLSFSGKALNSKPWLSGRPCEDIRLEGATKPEGLLVSAITGKVWGHLSFLHLWGHQCCLAFTLHARVGSFVDSDRERYMDFASITKNQLYHSIKIPKWRIWKV